MQYRAGSHEVVDVAEEAGVVLGWQQVLQRAQQTQSQLRKQQRPSIEIPQQQNYESKIDRMLTQSPKRKPERIY